MTTYLLLHLKDPSANHSGSLLERIRENWGRRIDALGVRHYGTFTGLFGLATNEVYWMTALEAGAQDPQRLTEEGGFRVLDRAELVPTVRPARFERPDREGLWVFRWFAVQNAQVEEVARLSEQAWVHFEGGFDTQIHGLFAEADRTAARGRMLLLTWYRNLGVWESSRRPAPEAVDLFTRRQRLTLEATPIATRLAR